MKWMNETTVADKKQETHCLIFISLKLLMTYEGVLPSCTKFKLCHKELDVDSCYKYNVTLPLCHCSPKYQNCDILETMYLFNLLHHNFLQNS